MHNIWLLLDSSLQMNWTDLPFDPGSIYSHCPEVGALKWRNGLEIFDITAEHFHLQMWISWSNKQKGNITGMNWVKRIYSFCIYNVSVLLYFNLCWYLLSNDVFGEFAGGYKNERTKGVLWEMLYHIHTLSHAVYTADPHAQRHPEQTFSGLIWLKG